MNGSKVYVVGAGGHAKVVISVLEACQIPIAGVLDDDSSRWGTALSDYPILGPTSLLEEDHNPRAILAIGSNKVRERLVNRYASIQWQSLLHPNAFVHSSVKMSDGSVVFAGAIIQPDVKIGSHVIINTGTTVDHDCTLGDYAHIAPGCHLAGNVTVGKGALLGIGVSVIPGIRIGDWAIVGAGAVVINDVPAGATVAGSPAKEIHKTS